MESLLFTSWLFPTPFSVSPLSAVNLFTISILSNTGWIEVNPSPLGGTCADGRSTCSPLASACWHLALGRQLLHPHLHSWALWGSITWFINVCECLECFPTGGPWVKYIRWHLLKQRKEPRKRENWGRKGRHLGVGMRMCQVEVPGQPWDREQIAGYIQGSEPNVATGYRDYSLLAPG